MIIPLTKMYFHVNNGFGEQLTGNGLSAEYDFIRKELVWRKWGEQSLRKQINYRKKILSILPLFSPLVIFPLLSVLGGYTTDIKTPYERLGDYSYILPLVFGLMLFLTFEYLMLLIMETPELCAPPSKHARLQYFEEIYNFSIKHNNAVGNYKTPYLVNIVAVLFIIIIAIPTMLWLYNMPSTLGEYLLKLFIFGMLLSLLPNILWNMIFKAVMIKKLIKQEKEK